MMHVFFKRMQTLAFGNVYNTNKNIACKVKFERKFLRETNISELY